MLRSSFDGKSWALHSNDDNLTVVCTLAVPYAQFRRFLSIVVQNNWLFGDLSFRWAPELDANAVEVIYNDRSVVLCYSCEAGALALLVPKGIADEDLFMLRNAILPFLKFALQLAHRFFELEQFESTNGAETDGQQVGWHISPTVAR